MCVVCPFLPAPKKIARKGQHRSDASADNPADPPTAEPKGLPHLMCVATVQCLLVGRDACFDLHPVFFYLPQQLYVFCCLVVFNLVMCLFMLLFYVVHVQPALF